jgi:hypothetical protein
MTHRDNLGELLYAAPFFPAYLRAPLSLDLVRNLLQRAGVHPRPGPPTSSHEGTDDDGFYHDPAEWPNRLWSQRRHVLQYIRTECGPRARRGGLFIAEEGRQSGRLRM